MSRTIKEQFAEMDTERHGHLEKARECASLTLPSLLPRLSHNKDDKLSEPFTTVGTDGVSSLSGAVLGAVFPSNVSFFTVSLSEAVQNNKTISPEALEAANQYLFQTEAIYHAALESSPYKANENKGYVGFRTAMLQHIQQGITLGDSLCYMEDDITFRTFRLPQYVIERDDFGRTLCIITRENVVAMSLTEEQFRKAKLSYDQYKTARGPSARTELFTRCQWNHDTKRWVIEQEVNGVVINTREEAVSPYFPFYIDLPSGENYGRGIVERNLGELRGLNELERRILEFAGVASMGLVVLDQASNIREDELTKPPGSILRGVVRDGQVQDIGVFKANNYADFKVIHDSVIRKVDQLERRFLRKQGAVRDSERTTAAEILNVTIPELDAALGNLYAPIADSLQKPLVARLRVVLEKKNVIAPVPTALKDWIKVEYLTGSAALSRQQRAQKILQFLAVAQQFPPEAQDYINSEMALNVLARYMSVTERGIVHTPEEVANIRNERAQREAALQAQNEMSRAAAQSAGAVATTAATPPVA